MPEREKLLQEYTQTHPEIDAIVVEYIHKNDYLLRSSEKEEEVRFILLQDREDQYAQHLDLPTKEMNALDKEGKATFIVHKLKSMNSFKHGLLLFIPILFIVIVATFVLLHFGLGLGLPNNDLMMAIYVIVCSAICIPPFLAIISFERRRVDLAVRAVRPNIVRVFRVIAEVQGSEKKKKAYLSRAASLES